MELNKSTAWIARWARSKFGEQIGMTVPPMVQPTLQCDWAWPLALKPLHRTGTLNAGATNLDFYPGEAPDPPAYPNEMRHHAVYTHCACTFGGVVAMNVEVLAPIPDLVFDRLYTGAAALVHFPLAGIEVDRRYFCYPYRFRISIATGNTETYDVRIVRFDLPESDPLPIS